MRRAALAACCSVALAGCVKGARAPACTTGETNRCSCPSGLEGVQQCLASGEAFGLCACTPCPDGSACVPVPSLIGLDIDQAGAAVDAAGLRLPDPVDPDGFVTVQQVADPPVQVLEQTPPAGTPVKPGTRLVLKVTLPPDQESLGFPNSHFLVGRLTTYDDADSAQRYYDVLDPGPFPTRSTLADWKAANGFGTAADAEASAVYMTHTDLGFGRHMHMRRKGKHVAFYVDNYPTIEDAVAGTRFFATVAMEYSPGPNGKDTDPFFTQFYVFNKKGERIVDPILDSHPAKYNPSVCLVCHGGFLADKTYAHGGNLNSRFIPFDLDAESFLDRPGYRREDQEAAFKAFNEAVELTWRDIAATYPPTDPAPVPELIDKWYGGTGHPSPTFISGVTPDGWTDSLESQDLYQKVFARSCQTCHAQRGPGARDFSRYSEFAADKLNIQKRVFEEAAMPLSERGFLNFWLSYPNEPKVLASWLGPPATPFHGPGKPIARPLPLTGIVNAGAEFTMNGTDSQFADAFEWRQTAGTPVTLVDKVPNGSVVSFVAPPRGTNLSFELRVSGLGLFSLPAAVAVVARSAPDAPAGASALPGAGSATVQWTAPAFDGLSPITGYTITVTPGGAVVSAPAGATSATVGSLQPGITYTFDVAAVNAVGTGPAKRASLRVPTPPGAPVGVTAVSTHAGGTLQIGWTPPADTGGVALQGFTVTCLPSGSAAASGSATSALVTSLANGVTYTCTVVASNVAGDSPASAPAAASPDGPPAPPTGFSAANASGAEWDLAWTAPADTGGMPLTGYLVTWAPPDGVASVAVGPAATGVRIGAAQGLVNGTAYTFSVAAVNAIGEGPAATTTPPGKPVITSPVSGASTGPNQIPVTWTPAAGNGSSITGYTVQAQVTQGIAITTVTVPGTSTSATITGLSNCTAYDLTVIAVSGGGSTASDPVGSVTPRQAPDVPSGLSLIAVGNVVGDLLFSWAPSDSHGCGTVTYDVEMTRPGPIVTTSGVGTATSFDNTESGPSAIAACPYPSVNCISPRLWSFRVRANTAGGSSAFSTSISGTPRMGYDRDAVSTIWSTTALSCVGCHTATLPLHLDGTPSTGITCSGGSDCTYKSILNRSPPDIQTPVDNSFLLTCPTDKPPPSGTPTGLCFSTGHPGGHRFDVGSVEYNAIQRWIQDGFLR